MGFLTRCKRLFSFAFLLQNRNTFFSFFLKSFLILSEKQHPAAENIDKTIMRLQQPFTYYYFIQEFDENVGAVRVVDKGEKDTAKRISPIFVLPQYQRLGIAQKAIRMVEALHGSSNWELSTILQEKVNCRLYEKMGYRQTGKTEVITDKMTLVFYKKD